VLGDSLLLPPPELLWSPLLGPSAPPLLLLLLLLLLVLSAAVFEVSHEVVSKCRWLVIQLSSSAMEVSLQSRWHCNGQECGGAPTMCLVESCHPTLPYWWIWFL
jgi:hypothetical protein